MCWKRWNIHRKCYEKNSVNNGPFLHCSSSVGTSVKIEKWTAKWQHYIFRWFCWKLWIYGTRWSSVVLLEKFTSHAIPRSHLLYKNEKLRHLSYCVIWDDMEHDVAMVYQVQNQVLKKVLASLPETKDVKLIFRQLCKSIYKPEKFIQSVST